MLLAGPSYALLTNHKSTSNYVISSGSPEMKALTACCWIKTNLETGTPHFMSYATTYHSNSFLFSKPHNALRMTIFSEAKRR